MMDARYLAAWAGAFALTQAIEAPIYLWRCVPGQRGNAVLASTWTHPVLWFAAVPLWRRFEVEIAAGLGWSDLASAETLFVHLCEIAIVVVEGWWLRRCGGRRPWLWALAANGASYCAGEAIYAASGWLAP